MYIPCACIGLSLLDFSVFNVWFEEMLSRFSILSMRSNMFSNSTAIVFFKSENKVKTSDGAYSKNNICVFPDSNLSLPFTIVKCEQNIVKYAEKWG